MPNASYNKLPYNVRQLIYKRLPPANQARTKQVSKTFFPSTHCKSPSQLELAKHRLPTHLKRFKGAVERIKGGDTSANTFAAAVPNTYKKMLFPGYAGHANARSFFSTYNISQRYNRYTVLMNQGRELEQKKQNLPKQIKNLLNILSQ